MEFFNEEGRKVGELKNFANKRVRDPELINQKRQRKNLTGGMPSRLCKRNRRLPSPDLRRLPPALLNSASFI